MATAVRYSDLTIEELLYTQTYEFDFNQAIRILQALTPDSVPLGEGSDPSHEAVTIKSRVTLSVSSSDLYSLKKNEAALLPILTVNFLGIAGIQGPLPIPYTEIILERGRNKDTALQDFLDVFNHRLVSLWYKVRKKIILGIDQVTPDKTNIGKTLLDFIGLESPALRNRLSISDNVILSNAGLLWHKSRSIRGLKILLKAFFRKEIHITEFIGTWNKGDPLDFTRIGKGGNFNILGQNTILGRKSWNQAAGIVISVGPVPWFDFIQYFPKNIHYQVMTDLCLFYLGIEKKIYLDVYVQKETVPPIALNRTFRLGVDTWLTPGNGVGFKEDPKSRIRLSINY